MAIRDGASKDGFVYQGQPVTSGFDRIRQPARSLSIGLVLNQGCCVWGDMMAVQYSGAGGRDPLFVPEYVIDKFGPVLTERLTGLVAASFRQACDLVCAPLPNGTNLPLSVQYGVTQALLQAFASNQKTTMAEVICGEFNCPITPTAVPLYAQSGDDRYDNVDKMILKDVDILPHGLINSAEKFGADGSAFLEYLGWVVARISRLGGQGYHPTLHFDLYGWAGMAFDHDIESVADFIARATEYAGPFQLQLESPVDFGSRDAQIEGLSSLTQRLKTMGCPTRIVADEWCNTLEDIKAFAKENAAHILQIKMPDVGSVADTAMGVMVCKAAGIGAYVGGSCAETDLSARISVHIAVATQADMLLAKPGMGVDEGLTIVGNEQARLLAELRHRKTR